MQTNVNTPQQVLHLPQHLVVPVYQRPYVWNEEDQWRPLWADVRRMAELRLSGTAPTAQHFLGAIVLQQLFVPQATMTQTAIVDGQQRLTTLQLLMDAAGAVLDEIGQDHLAQRLGFLTLNGQQFAVNPGDLLKLQHRNRDADAFRDVILSEPPVDYGDLDRSSRVVLAHEFFAQCVRDWVGTEDDAGIRASHLVSVLESGLQLVVITLQAEEDSQEIFETLNARGTPLTATDLIKNFVFQRLAHEGHDVEVAYQQRWMRLESKFWEHEVSSGRLLMPRSALFIAQWLGSRVGEEISPRSAFARFRHFVEHEVGSSIAQVLDDLIGQAERYEAWVRRSQGRDGDLPVIEMFLYRMRAAGSDTATPVLLALTDPRLGLADGEITTALRAVESWLVRRMIVRLQSANHGSVVAELVRLVRSAGDPSGVGDAVTRFLAAQSVATTYWPTDNEIRGALAEARAYRNYPRGRLRMFLEACEDALRGYNGGSPSRTGSRVTRGTKHIEHLLPQRWRIAWPVDGEIAELARDQHVHRLGNLTLLTASLNSSVSNGPWLGGGGKRGALNRHDVLLLNSRVQEVGTDGWDESRIDERTAVLSELLIQTWPVPEGHAGLVERVAVSSEDIGLDKLLVAGVLQAGELLHNDRTDVRAVVLANGWLSVREREYPSVSAAGRAVASSVVNGWWFWRVSDGRRLRQVRDEYARARQTEK